MGRWLRALVVFGLLAAGAPAHGEPSPVAREARPLPAPAQRPLSSSVDEVQQAIGEFGAWSLEYGALLTEASAIMDQITTYTAILDRFANGEIRARRALEEMQAWRDSTVSRAQTLRANAAALRPPPSLWAMGPEGARLENVLQISRADLPALVDEMIVSLQAIAALGEEAIRSPTKAADARRRAVYQSSVQLIRIDTRRISATAAALSTEHPNRHIMETTIAYHTALAAFPSHELRVLDGADPSPGAVAATLRQSAQSMRTSLSQADLNANRLAREVRETPAPPEAQQMRQSFLQMVNTFPETVLVYGRLVVILDDTALYLEQGGDVSDAWVRQEDASLPVFEEIARLEDQRTQLAAQLRR